MSRTTNKFAPEMRQRAVRIVLNHEADHPPITSASHGGVIQSACLIVPGAIRI